jgi:phosphomannomutase
LTALPSPNPEEPGVLDLARATAERAGADLVLATDPDADRLAGGDTHALIYGYEQAVGYAVRPDLVADKDGISAALLALQIATEQARHGRTLLDRLDAALERPLATVAAALESSMRGSQ